MKFDKKSENNHYKNILFKSCKIMFLQIQTNKFIEVVDFDFWFASNESKFSDSIWRL